MEYCLDPFHPRVAVPSARNPQRISSRAGVPRRSENSVTEAAARMMSETAHDLRAPLTTIRESVRIVRDGDMGEVTPGQQICLDSAIDQCDCMEQMIGEMVQLERLRTGTPRVRRQWITVEKVRQSINDTLRPWVVPREIDVLWDGMDDPTVSVFADPAMLRRLIVNLVTNAVRVTRQGGQVMIRLKWVDSTRLRWSVIDTGRGISQQDLEQIADRQVSFSGGEGLGLSISRQLAAVHFSKLSIQSRVGTGTEVSFETAAAGPRSVAEVWARWRIAQLTSEQQELVTWRHHPEGTSQRKVRLDPPSYRVELHHEAARPRCPHRFAAGIVTVGATTSRDAADEFDKLLQGQCFLFDFVYRINARRWVWVLDTDEDALQDRIESITAAAASAIHDLRVDWSSPQMIPVESGRTAKRLSDLLVRETLYVAASGNVMDNNEVRLGTKPIEPSAVAANRLDEELARLASQMKNQSGKLRQQARDLRY